MAYRTLAKSNMRTPIGFKLWFGFILTLILCVWLGVGFVFYRIATDPEGAGHFAGRIIGGVVNGAQGKP